MIYRTQSERAAGMILSALASVVLAGCATVGAKPEETVTARAEERWKLLLSGELAAAYEYLSPGYRTSISSSAWQRQVLSRQVAWDAAEISGVSCSEDACEVAVRVDASVYGKLPGVPRMQFDDTITENWALLDGQWFMVP